MDGILLGILLFLDIIRIIIIIDIVLSWVSLFGIQFRPKFVSSTLDPIYGFIRSIIPTQIGPFDFAPIIVILLCIVLKGAIFNMFPNLYSYVNIPGY